MKITRYRSHKINTGPGTYESLDLGATVEIDTEDPDYAKFSVEELQQEASEVLDILLDNDVERALKLPGIITESHIWDFYDKS